MLDFHYIPPPPRCTREGCALLAQARDHVVSCRHEQSVPRFFRRTQQVQRALRQQRPQRLFVRKSRPTETAILLDADRKNRIKHALSHSLAPHPHQAIPDRINRRACIPAFDEPAHFGAIRLTGEHHRREHLQQKIMPPLQCEPAIIELDREQILRLRPLE